MKTMSFWLAIVMCAVVAPQAKADSFNNSYFPLGEGRSWKYEASGSEFIVTNLQPRKMGGMTVVPQHTKTESGNTYSYYVEEDGGIYEYATQTEGQVDPIIKENKSWVIKKPFKTGTTWETALEMDMGILGNIFGTQKCEISNISDTVTISTGTYDGLLRSHCIGSGTMGKKQMEIEDTTWYAKNIGIIKSVFRISMSDSENNIILGALMGFPTEGITLEMVSYE